jgi:hypothetical protein
MPKSRGRKRNKHKLSARTNAILDRQLERFRAQFGRDPGPGDPIFFDPSKDTPTPLNMEDEVLAAMNKANLPPEFAYAYRKTGLLGLSPDKSAWPQERVEEWNAAVEEGRAIQAAEKRPDRPDPQHWNTKITDLLLSPFTKDDLGQVHECLRAIAPIEARGMKLVTRIELAAVLLASACDHGYDSGEDTDGP